MTGGAAAPVRAEEPLRVGEVRIRSLDVFSPEEAAKGWFYRAANAIHIETRVEVIRKFLLFRPGEPFDRFLLEQTERNLRQLRFIKSATVTASAPHGGIVDVDVVTQDSWTLSPSGSFAVKGGITTWSLSLEERNLLGFGKDLGVDYEKGTERTVRSISYHDPYLFGAYWAGDLTVADNTDGGQVRVQVQKPFAYFQDRFAALALYNHPRLEQNLYGGGVAVSRYRLDREQGQAFYARALASGDTFARRLGLGFEYLDDRFSATDVYPLQIVPADHTFRFVTLSYQEEHNNFLKLNYVNRDLRFEDFNLGPNFSASFGVSPAGFGAPTTTYRVRTAVGAGLRLGPGSFVLAQADFSTRLEPGVTNAILLATVGWVRKWDTELVQTTVSRVQTSLGWNLDQEVQFFADGGTGLRGYHLYAFEGNKSVIVNLEHRIFSGKEILQLASPGVAIFVDTGLAEPSGTPLRLSNFKTDIGVGLRLGIARAAGNNILRVDLAYALNVDQQGRKGWLVSFSSGQSF
jgi:hypothetical protein